MSPESSASCSCSLWKGKRHLRNVRAQEDRLLGGCPSLPGVSPLAAAAARPGAQVPGSLAELGKRGWWPQQRQGKVPSTVPSGDRTVGGGERLREPERPDLCTVVPPVYLEPPALSPRLNHYFSRASHPVCPLRKDAPAGRDLRPLSSPFLSHFTDTGMDMLGPEMHSPVMTDVSGNRDLLTFSPVSFLFPVPPRGGDTTVSHLTSCWHFNFLMLPGQEILPFYNPDPQALLQAPFPLTISSVNTGKSPRSFREGSSSCCPYHLMP